MMKQLDAKKLTIFDYYRNIIKKEPKFSKEVVNSSFDIVGFNRLMSYDKMNILLANEMNGIAFLLDKYTIYLFYYYACDQKKFVPFLKMKKDVNEEEEKIKEMLNFCFPDYSEEKVCGVIDILKPVLKNTNIEDLSYTGGLKEKK
jgi:hypothetical protein